MPTPRMYAPRRLVGREAQLALIGSHLAAMDQSRGTLLLFSGEPGIGKTRLAEEIVALARAGGAGTAWTTAWQGEGAPPLWPWVQILRQLAGSDHALGDFVAESPGICRRPVRAVRGGGCGHSRCRVRRIPSWWCSKIFIGRCSIGEGLVLRRRGDSRCEVPARGHLSPAGVRSGHIAELARVGTTVRFPGCRPRTQRNCCERPPGRV